jgi:hypothetical protein
MKNYATEKSLNWDAHYVGIKAMRERNVNYTTLDEVISLALQHPSLACAPTTIADQIPVFTEWVVSGSSWNTKSRKKNSLSKPKGL